MFDVPPAGVWSSVEDSIPTIGAVALLAILAVGCSDMQRVSLPTGPSELNPSAASVPPSSGRLLRTERWHLDLTIRDVAGVECGDAVGNLRSVDLATDLHDDGTIAMYYDDPSWPAAHAGEWTGWTLENGFEGSGMAYEGMPCSGADTEPSGAPSTLTGYFSADRTTFTANEVRRYMGRPDGEIVYYVEWRARRVG